MPVAAIVANPRVGADLGLLGGWLRHNGFDVMRLTRDDVLAPDAADGADLLILLGSVWTMARPMDDQGDPPAAAAAIAAELTLVRRWVDADRPLLGICFGGQLLSVALGGTVRRQPQPVLGWITPASDTPALRHPWLTWHADAFTVPDGATALAGSAHAPLAFRYRRAWGVQFHPELDADVLAVMADDLGATPEVSGPLVAVAQQRATEQRAESLALFDAFWADVSGRS